MKRRVTIVASAAGLAIAVAGGVTGAVVATSASTPPPRHVAQRPTVGVTTTTQAPPTTVAPPKPLPTTTTRPPPPPTTSPPSAGTAHVMVVVMENESYSDVVGDPSLPYVNSLAADYVVLTQNFAMAHPSLPNYLELTSGSSWGITSDCSPGGTCLGGAPTLLTEMDTAGVTWGGYFENLPSAGYSGGDTGGDDGFGNQLYQQHHNPFVYYPSLSGDLSKTKPYGSLLSDLNSAGAPDFVFVVPNMVDDMHDGPMTTGDKWLGTQIPAIQSTAWYKAGGTILIEWDEAADSDTSGTGGASGGRVAGIVVSAALRGHGPYGNAVNTAGIERSIAEVFGLDPLKDALDPTNGSLGSLL